MVFIVEDRGFASEGVKFFRVAAGGSDGEAFVSERGDDRPAKISGGAGDQNSFHGSY